MACHSDHQTGQQLCLLSTLIVFGAKGSHKLSKITAIHSANKHRSTLLTDCWLSRLSSHSVWTFKSFFFLPLSLYSVTWVMRQSELLMSDQQISHFKQFSICLRPKGLSHTHNQATVQLRLMWIKYHLTFRNHLFEVQLPTEWWREWRGTQTREKERGGEKR